MGLFKWVHMGKRRLPAALTVVLCVPREVRGFMF